MASKQYSLPSRGALRLLLLLGSLLSSPMGAEPPVSKSPLDRAPRGLEEITEESKLELAVFDQGARFGLAIALSGDVIVSGAPSDDGPAGNQGSAYVFERDPGGPRPWRVVKKLLASDGESGDSFGEYLAMGGKTAVVTAWKAGKAYVFERNAGGLDSWEEVRILVGNPAEQFGSAAAVDGDTVVIGAQTDSERFFRSGAAYVFERNEGGPGQWGQTAKLTASDAGTDHFFGSAVAVDRDRVAVGSGAGPGKRAYVFERSGPGAADWSEVAILLPSGDGGEFGQAIVVDGETVVVGAPSETDGQLNTTGAAYVYDRDHGGAGAWGEVKRLSMPDDGGGQSDKLGISVALQGDSLVVGSSAGGGAFADSGVVWLYNRNEGGPDNWGVAAKIFATDAADSDGLGVSVALDGNTIAAGASGVNAEASNEGAAYTFLLGPTLWSSGLCPGPTTIGLAGSTPNELAGLIWALSPGIFTVPAGDCLGLELGLDQPNLLNTLRADADGEVRFDIMAPVGICDLSLQAIDLAACEASNVTAVDR